MSNSCGFCKCEGELIAFGISNSSYTQYLCFQHYQELQYLHKQLKLLDFYGLTKTDSKFKDFPRPYPREAANKHDLALAMEVTELDEQSSIGTVICSKCGGSWVIDSKHAYRFLADEDECNGTEILKK